VSITETPQQVALVTGGSRGIGKASVLTLAKAGFDVAFSYAANEAAALEVQHAVQALGRRCLTIKADAASVEQATKLVQQTATDLGRLDVLVNNAGITKDNLLIRLSDDDWENVLKTNLSGVFYTTRAAAKIMMKQRYGRIVNITSVVGVHGNAGQGNYAASKAGVIGFTKSMAKELGSRNITVNAVAPGFITTDMTDHLPTDKIVEHIPLGRLGAPDDIANAVLFLVTSGNYVTGQVLQVDGGLVL
jgi:3-oxoacyl-[acyl-carrier protein] reductase